MLELFIYWLQASEWKPRRNAEWYLHWLSCRWRIENHANKQVVERFSTYIHKHYSSIWNPYRFYPTPLPPPPSAINRQRHRRFNAHAHYTILILWLIYHFIRYLRWSSICLLNSCRHGLMWFRAWMTVLSLTLY